MHGHGRKWCVVLTLALLTLKERVTVVTGRWSMLVTEARGQESTYLPPF